jgi:hypothetical protein
MRRKSRSRRARRDTLPCFDVVFKEVIVVKKRSLKGFAVGTLSQATSIILLPRLTTSSNKDGQFRTVRRRRTGRRGNFYQCRTEDQIMS